MVSPAHRRLFLATAGAAIAAWFGTGLHPAGWAAWCLPFLAFVAAAQAPRRWRFLPGMVAMAIGEMNLWDYLSFLPVPVRLGLLLLPALAFGLCTAWFGRLMCAGRPGWALIAPAAAWTTYEYVASLVSPHSTFGALAYTQAAYPVVLQLGAVGGIWLIDAVILVIAGAAAVVVCLRWERQGALRFGLVGVAMLASALGFGVLRLHQSRNETFVTVGLVASDLGQNLWFDAPEASVGIARRYLAQIPRLREAGAEIAVLPEHLFALREAGADRNAPEIERELHAAAATNGMILVVGVDRRDASGAWWNEARVYHPDGALHTYVKHHLLPGPESIYRPGHEYTVLDHAGKRWGVAICKDLDFPGIGRAYASRSVAALVVPAFDFEVDGWLHSRMAVMRGVESGFSLVRAAKRGLLTVSNPWGEVVGETAVDNDGFSHLVIRCPLQPIRTLYARFGDWVAWVAGATFGLAVIVTFADGARRHGVNGTRR